jgi:glycerol-3-phosphate acyltransferase PlsY
VTAPDNAAQLEDLPHDIKLKLGAVWASLTLCYLYCDYFELYQAGKLQSMLAGQVAPLGPASQGVLLAVSMLLSLPALMVILSIALPARINRPANLVLGSLFTFIMVVFLVMPGVWLYYKYFAAVEAALAAYAVWLAWRWPTNANVTLPPQRAV